MIARFLMPSAAAAATMFAVLHTQYTTNTPADQRIIVLVEAGMRTD